MPSIQTILHPTDFSDNSRSAFRTACSLTKEHSARLILFHVPPQPASKPLEGAESRESLKPSHFPWPEPPDPSIRVEHRVAEGSAAIEILRLAQALKCDVIVMGTRRTGLEPLPTGSVAEQVLRKAPCPVLVVRTPPSEHPPAEAQAQIKPGEIVDVGPLRAEPGSAKTNLLAKADNLEVIRLIVPAGKEIQEHKAKGELVVHCLEGQVAFTAFGKTQTLGPGQLLYLHTGDPHTVKGIENASLLLTIFLAKH